jgi:hypothetical protein
VCILSGIDRSRFADHVDSGLTVDSPGLITELESCTLPNLDLADLTRLTHGAERPPVSLGTDRIELR